MIVKEWQAKKLYINKAQLEKALGISLDELPTKSFSYNEPLADYLIPYSSMEYFDIEDCVALLVGEKTDQFRLVKTRNKYDFYGIKEAIAQAILNGQLGNSEIIQDYCGPNGTEFYKYKFEHRAIEEWAKHHGYKWDLPPYKAFKLFDKNNDLLQKTTDEADTSQQRIAELEQQLSQGQSNNTDEVAKLNAIIQQQAETIAQLEESLKNAELQSVFTEDRQRRTSQPQKAIFTLLALKNYPNCQSRNELFNLINAELKANGIITSDIKYPTLDRLIDEDIRLGEGVKKSPFPPKQK